MMNAMGGHGAMAAMLRQRMMQQQAQPESAPTGMGGGQHHVLQSYTDPRAASLMAGAPSDPMQREAYAVANRISPAQLGLSNDQINYAEQGNMGAVWDKKTGQMVSTTGQPYMANAGNGGGPVPGTLSGGDMTGASQQQGGTPGWQAYNAANPGHPGTSYPGGAQAPGSSSAQGGGPLVVPPGGQMPDFGSGNPNLLGSSGGGMSSGGGAPSDMGAALRAYMQQMGGGGAVGAGNNSTGGAMAGNPATTGGFAQGNWAPQYASQQYNFDTPGGGSSSSSSPTTPGAMGQYGGVAPGMGGVPQWQPPPWARAMPMQPGAMQAY